eukprot:m.2830 g.2830  ORF g.2830 m.2830 type:complete len:806 (+) comp1239_c0_seq1:59-2476(+)
MSTDRVQGVISKLFSPNVFRSSTCKHCFDPACPGKKKCKANTPAKAKKQQSVLVAAADDPPPQASGPAPATPLSGGPSQETQQQPAQPVLPVPFSRQNTPQTLPTKRTASNLQLLKSLWTEPGADKVDSSSACHRCGLAVSDDEDTVQLMQQQYHARCLRCLSCPQELTKGTCNMVHGEMFCALCAKHQAAEAYANRNTGLSPGTRRRSSLLTLDAISGGSRNQLLARALSDRSTASGGGRRHSSQLRLDAINRGSRNQLLDRAHSDRGTSASAAARERERQSRRSSFASQHNPGRRDSRSGDSHRRKDSRRRRASSFISTADVLPVATSSGVTTPAGKHSRTASTRSRNLAYTPMVKQLSELKALSSKKSSRPSLTSSLDILTFRYQNLAKNPEKNRDALQDLSDTLMKLGNHHRERSNLGLAAQAYDTAFDIQLRALKTESVADDLELLADTCDSEAELCLAMVLLEKALALREKEYGKDHLFTGNLEHKIALVAEGLRDLPSAAAHYQRAFRILVEQLGPKHIETAYCLNNAAGVMEQLEDYEGAAAMFTEALRIKREHYGPNHPSTANTMNNLALVLEAQGHLEAALTMHLEAVSVYKTAFGLYHASTAKSLHNAASVQEKLGNLAGAVELYQQASDIKAAVLSRDDPECRASETKAEVLNLLLSRTPTQEELAQAEEAVAVAAAASANSSTVDYESANESFDHDMPSRRNTASRSHRPSSVAAASKAVAAAAEAARTRCNHQQHQLPAANGNAATHPAWGKARVTSLDRIILARKQSSLKSLSDVIPVSIHPLPCSQTWV